MITAQLELKEDASWGKYHQKWRENNCVSLKSVSLLLGRLHSSGKLLLPPHIWAIIPVYALHIGEIERHFQSCARFLI
jgi:hypothetical protein